MNLQKFTIKAREAVQMAMEMAASSNHQGIHTAHVLKALLKESGGMVPSMIEKIGANESNLQSAINSSLEKLPKVSGVSVSGQYLTEDLKKVFDRALAEAEVMGDAYVSSEHILIALAESKDLIGSALLNEGIDKKRLVAVMTEMRGGQAVNDEHAEDRFQALEKYTRNLNDLARKGKIDPVIGRDEEIRRVLQILSRRTKNNPILIGEPGVGKTAIAEGLAIRIVQGDVPDNLRDRIIVSLDMGSLIAGAKYRGEFEDRLKAVVKEVTGSDGQIVMFIDEIHTLVGAGAAEGAMDAANILKPALARGELRAIGATTLDEYRKHLEKDKALERRFQSVLVDEPSVEDTISILRGIKEKYEVHHGTRITDGAIVAAAELSHRYITSRFLPDKAIDLIDEAAAKLRIEIASMPESLDLLERQIRTLEIEKEAVKRDMDSEKMESIEKEIADLSEERDTLKLRWKRERELIQQIQDSKEKIEAVRFESDTLEREGDFSKVAELRYGQIPNLEKELKEANDQLAEVQKGGALLKEEIESEDIAEIVSRWTGIPVSRMLESERAKLLNMEDHLAERVVGQEKAVRAVSDAVRRGRAGLQDANRPIGSFIFLGTTGVGKTELARALAKFLFNDESNMIRIDMSEYQERHAVSRLVGAPPGYVGFEDGGQLTEAVRRKPYSVVLLDEIEKAHPEVFNILLQVLEDGRLTDNKGRTADFKNTIIIMTSNLGSEVIQKRIDELGGVLDDAQELMMQNEMMTLLKKKLRPEFLNRIDETIIFNPLTKEHLREIVSVQVDRIADLARESHKLELTLTNAAKDYLSQKGFDPSFGARPLKRVIQKEIANKLAEDVLSGWVKGGETIEIDAKDAGLVFAIVKAKKKKAAKKSQKKTTKKNLKTADV